jgi:uncharacterized protein (TIGR00375 family)
MKIIADFHIHSKYSRATSQDMDLEHLHFWAKAKGINVVGTGDFTHPGWILELKKKLEPKGGGLFKLKKEFELGPQEIYKSKLPEISLNREIYFLLTSEISCIYSKNGRVRKIHLLILAPDFEAVEKISVQLSWIGNLKSDGRPILGLDSLDLAKIVFNSSPKCLVIPCHAWTPWFSIFGANSGFDSIEECFEDKTKYIKAIETGLSSDPEMNWRLSALDNIILISNSDAHSPQKLGREANVLELENLSYENIAKALSEKGMGENKMLYTVEFFPEEGKYHFDGHRFCGVRLSPKETIKNNYRCPKCGKLVTVGVAHRMEKLADREEGIAAPLGSAGSRHLIPLEEIIAECLGTKPGTKGVLFEYKNLVSEFGSEFSLLLSDNLEKLSDVASAKIKEGIKRVWEGKINILPGYDGTYGIISIFGKKQKEDLSKQGKLL